MRCRFGFPRVPGRGFAVRAEQFRLPNVAVTAAVADHGVVLDSLEGFAASQTAEFVGAEVDGAVDHRTGRKAGDARDRRAIASANPSLAALGQELTGVPPQCFGDHELGAQQADTIHRLRRDVLGMRRHRQVDIDECGRGSGRGCAATPWR